MLVGTATKQADGTYKLFVNVCYKNSTGEYNVHLYYVQNDGQLVGVEIKLQVNKRGSMKHHILNVIVVGQDELMVAIRLPQQAAFQRRSLGNFCITGQTVLPTTTADYLYHSTDEFNKEVTGTTSHGIVLAARH